MKRNSFYMAFAAIAATPGRFCITFLSIALSLGITCATAMGSTLIDLQNENSSVTIDPYSQDGVNNWTVDGVNQLFQQWFWYRIGETGGEHSIDTLSAPVTAVYGSPSQFCTLTYSGSNGLGVEVAYLLTGSPEGSGHSDLSETISLTNNSATSMDLHFFQYSNFTLNGSSTGASVWFPNVNTVDQQNGQLSLTETVETPAPNEHEGAYYPTTLNELNSGTPTTLSNNPAIGGNEENGVGPGDVTWAYEWDTTLAPGGSLVISKDKRLDVMETGTPAPEPSTLVLLLGAGLGLIGWAWRRRRS